ASTLPPRRSRSARSQSRRTSPTRSRSSPPVWPSTPRVRRSTSTARAMSADVGLRIGGIEREGGAGAQDVIDPRTGEPAYTVALASPQDLDDALDTAAASRWADTPAAERGAILKASAQLLSDRAKDIAADLVIESGKLPAEAEGELARAVETFAWNGEEAGRI